MTEPLETLRARLVRLHALDFSEAYERIVDGDPLGLELRAEAALREAAQWTPVEIVALRAARHLAAALREVPAGEDEVATWVDAHVARAVTEARDATRAAEPREHEVWARHHARVAAALGVHDRLGRDAHVMFHILTEESRRLLLRGMHLARTRQTREWDAPGWGRFHAIWRDLVRAVLAEERR